MNEPKEFFRPTNKSRILGIVIALASLVLGVILLFFDLPVISISGIHSLPAGFGVMIIGFISGAMIGNFPVMREIREIIKYKAGMNQANQIPDAFSGEKEGGQFK